MNSALIGSVSEFDSVIKEVEKKMGYSFSDIEVENVFSFTVRKCEINGKGLDYVSILFENELRDYIMRAHINTRGIMNIKSTTASRLAAI